MAFSEGITEAMDCNREQIGEDRPTKLVMDEVGITAAELMERLVKAVKSHAGQAPQHDDMTWVALVRTRSNLAAWAQRATSQCG